MRIWNVRFIIFFIIISIAVALYGYFVKQEELNAVFIARIFFTGCITTLIYFIVVRRNEKKISQKD